MLATNAQLKITLVNELVDDHFSQFELDQVITNPEHVLAMGIAKGRFNVADNTLNSILIIAEDG